MSLRVLMVSDDFLPNPGGIAAHVDELCRGLSRRGHHVDLWAGHNKKHANGKAPSLSGPGKLLRNRSFAWSATGYVGTSWDTARGVRRLVRDGQYDVVHWHSLFWESPAVRLGARGMPRVFTNHSSGFLRAAQKPVGRQYMNWLLSFADAVIAPSTELAERTAEVRRDARVTMIPNGIDVELFQPGRRCPELAASFGLDLAHPVVVVPRRLVHKNGVDVLVRAIGQVQDVQLLVIGEGPEQPALSELAQRVGAGDRVFFIGTVPRADMPKHLALADIGALPSRMEAISLAGLEMMASGLPLLATRVGGIPEFLTAPDMGRLVPSDEPAAMAEALRGLLSLAPEERASIGRRGRQSVVDRFSADACAARVEAVYRDTLERRS